METFIWTMFVLHLISFGINLASVQEMNAGPTIFSMICNLAIAVWAFVLVV